MTIATSIAMIPVKLPSGQELPLRETTSKYGNAWWSIMATKKNGEKYPSQYGVKVSGLGALPKVGDHVTVLGQQFTFVQNVGEDKQPRPANDKGQKQVVASGSITVPGHGKKVLRLLMTDCGEGAINVLGKIRGAGEGKKSAHPLDEL